MSHSTRVRGLKYQEIKPAGIKSQVALYTSAWIEIYFVHKGGAACVCRTLHECVDWNTACTFWEAVWQCRTLHECVDWNQFRNQRHRFARTSHSTRVRGLKYQQALQGFDLSRSHSTRVRGLKLQNQQHEYFWKQVALYTSAWIEMDTLRFWSDPSICRTLHECVDWNEKF